MPAPPALSPEKSEPAITSSGHPLAVFFDGECVFCNRWVARLMRADVRHLIRFGAKQGQTYQGVLRAHPSLAGVDSIVVLQRRDDGSEGALVRTAAILAAIERLPSFRFLAAILRFTPRPLADLGYRFVSKTRTMIFGRQDLCHIVQPEERQLFLD